MISRRRFWSALAGSGAVVRGVVGAASAVGVPTARAIVVDQIACPRCTYVQPLPPNWQDWNVEQRTGLYLGVLCANVRCRQVFSAQFAREVG